MRLLVLFAALSLAGCAATQQPEDASIVAAANEPLVCESPEQCSLYWRRAQAWVAQNSRYKIQIATDTIIETYSPPQAAVHRAFRILRIPGNGKTERITIASGCANIFGCSTTEAQSAAAFKQYVRSGAS
jgi:hypothetical protein